MLKEKNSAIARLEALLFLHGEPLSLEKISRALGYSRDEIEELIEAYRALLQEAERGFTLARDGSGKKVQLVTKAEFSNVLEQFVKEELREELTPASLETLSLIAYLGPVSRSKIEYLRGVNSSFILRTLLLRGLVERIIDSERSSAAAYIPSMECLRYLGVNAQSELPEFEHFRSTIAAVEKSESDNIPLPESVV